MGPFGGILLARIWEMRSREESFLATHHSQSLLGAGRKSLKCSNTI